MPNAQSEVLKSLSWPIYFVASLLIALPALDYVSNVWPLSPGDPLWRYGSAGVLSGFILTPLLGIVLALGAAAVKGHRLFIRVLSFVNVLLGPLILVVILMFALDVVQVRATVPAESKSVFDVGAAKAFVKYLTTASALVWLGVAGLRATRASKKGGGRPSEVPLVRAETG